MKCSICGTDFELHHLCTKPREEDEDGLLEAAAAIAFVGAGINYLTGGDAGSIGDNDTGSSTDNGSWDGGGGDFSGGGASGDL